MTAIAVITFVVAYVLIATERIHKTKAALGGAAIVLAAGVLDSGEAFFSHDTGVDWDVVLLIAPVTLLVCDRLGIRPAPFLIAEVLASNIGGAATLIGDPPNIIIGSRSGLSFNSFLVHMTPIVVLELAVFAVILPGPDLVATTDHHGDLPRNLLHEPNLRADRQRVLPRRRRSHRYRNRPLRPQRRRVTHRLGDGESPTRRKRLAVRAEPEGVARCHRRGSDAQHQLVLPRRTGLAYDFYVGSASAVDTPGAPGPPEAALEN